MSLDHDRQRRLRAAHAATARPMALRLHGQRCYLNDGSIWERQGDGLALVAPPDSLGWEIRAVVARRRREAA